MSPISFSHFTFVASFLLSNTFALPSGPSELLGRQAAANPNAALAGWTLVGCFTDNNPAGRTLQEHTITNPGMTPAICTEFCGNFTTPLNFAGTEFTDECFCDFNIQGTATKVNDTLCNFPCGGDSTLTCGGSGVVSVFQNSNKGVGPVPANKAKVGTWSFNGCFTDAVGPNPRSLLERFDIPAGVTIETCTAQCAAAGFSISGLEFGEECWCGNSFALPTANITAPLTDCSRACEADHTELCGAASRLSVYVNVVGTTVVPTTTAAPTTVKPTTTPTTVAPTTTAVPTTTAKPTTTPTTVVPTTTAAPTTTAKPTTTPTTVAPTTTKAG